MSIQSQIDRIRNNIAAAYQALTAKGAGVPDALTSEHLAETIESIEVGVDTSDADATASDIAVSKTAYVNGSKITGTISETLATYYTNFTANSYGSVTYNFTSAAIGGVSGSQPGFYFRASPAPRIFRSGSYIRVNVPAVFFGDATAADVAEGKTFSSADGMTLTGTSKTASLPKYVLRVLRKLEATSVVRVFFVDSDGSIKYTTFSNVTASNMTVYAKRVIIVATFNNYYGKIITTNCEATLLDSPDPSENLEVKGAVYVVNINDNENIYEYDSNAIVELTR